MQNQKDWLMHRLKLRPYKKHWMDFEGELEVHFGSQSNAKSWHNVSQSVDNKKNTLRDFVPEFGESLWCYNFDAIL